MTPSKAVDKVKTGGAVGEPVEFGPMALQLMAAFRDGVAPAEEDPAVVAARIAEQLLTAPDLASAFSESTTSNGPELVGRPLHIRDAVLRASELDNTVVYILIDAVDTSTGEQVVGNTSSPRVMAQLAWAKDHNHIGPGTDGLDVVFEEVGKAKVGQNAPIGLKLLT